jgi:hypothetical protein
MKYKNYRKPIPSLQVIHLQSKYNRSIIHNQDYDKEYYNLILNIHYLQ